jgi:hypothetical protein
MLDQSSFADRLERAGVPRDQANTHAELAWELIRSELSKRDDERSNQFWSTFFLAACASLAALIVVLAAKA